jgi:phosphoribosylformimino-5-aminoimidazole carboxamide ribotide isomerase
VNIIPAIDIIDGKCVRLTKGDYNTTKIYNENPVEVAQEFECHGFTHLHLVDLDGAKKGAVVNHKVLEQIALNTGLTIDFSGGIKTEVDIKKAFDNGALKVSLGSIAIEKEALFLEWLATYGADAIILAADAKDRKVATGGWLKDGGRDVIEFINHYKAKGLTNAMCTDIAKDGMLAGPSLDLYKDIIAQTGIDLIASGGVSSIQDLKDLKSIGCNSAIVGKAIYEGKITLDELAQLIP